MNTSDTLNLAADLIEKRGWTTGIGWVNESEDHPLCIEGAIAAAMGVEGGPGYRCPAYYAVSDYLGLNACGMFMWNDNLPFRQAVKWTADLADQDAATELARVQVVATLRAVAVIEAAKENDQARAYIRTSDGYLYADLTVEGAR